MDGLYRLPFSVEEFCSSVTLGIILVLNLDPSALFEVGSVVPVLQLGDDAFDISLAYQLEEPTAIPLHVVCIAHSGVRRPTYQYSSAITRVNPRP